MKREVVCFFVALFPWSISIASGDTELSLYRPFTETTQHPMVVVSAKKLGECSQASKLIKRDDAWHCTAEGNVYDPCFVQPYASKEEAVCPESPWSNKAIQITVASPLDNKNHERLDMSRNFPWALELSSGEKCQVIDTNDQYDGLPVHYRCEKNSELIGHVQRCDSMWKMLQHGSTGVETVQIARVWF